MASSSVSSTIELNNSSIRLTGPYGDWRDDLASQGYVVIKNAIPQERAQQYQQKALDWLKSFSPSLDLNDPSTWREENLPATHKFNLFKHYSVTHEKFMWEARQEPKDKPPNKPWPHVDQSPLRRGLHCVQGIINLSPAGPEDGSLILLPRSNTVTEKFFDEQTDPSTWLKNDFRSISETEMDWFKDKGMEPIKVLADPGDLILWDSRTVHWGGEPTAQSDTIRTVIYASYSPASMASKETLEAKQTAFRSYGATTHWAHDNVVLRDLLVYLPDGTVDPRNRAKPLEEAEHTDQMLKLAGMKPY
ncbi:hypothetical protein N7474_007021 [Penicillium riverlandense]|uniref:uncharacterized protein n=1 Tax=Penicillium riverlandense TaxID=1903569 RepID=UPI00254848C4|nr:uncharacterized protein N7474_007021 [Penicillium riverlandense]KAJ5815244.1 hypothetical protein N7474_007021 [Penicillium riverlandense]